MSLPTLPDSVSDALIVRPVSQLLIPSEVKLDCELSYKTIFNWTVFKLNSMQGGNELVLNRKGSSELLIRGRTLAEGSYMVILTVSMRGTKVYGVNKGYFRIERSPLIALISGGTRVTWNEDLIKHWSSMLPFPVIQMLCYLTPVSSPLPSHFLPRQHWCTLLLPHFSLIAFYNNC